MSEVKYGRSQSELGSRLPERNVERIRKIPVPPIVEEIVEVVQVVLHEYLQQRTPQIQQQIVGNV